MAQELRRLAAIVMADVVASSKLMSEDDSGTVAALEELRDDFILPGIATHKGRLVKTTGDGFLIEFGSALFAVLFSIELQVDLAASNAKARGGKKLQLRIGINIGDNIVDRGEDLYGDGVNIAERLQGIADAGGICIAQSTYDAIRGKFSGKFRDGGEPPLKNISQSVHVWHWSELETSITKRPSTKPRARAYQQERHRRKRLGAASEIEQLTSRLKPELLKTTEELPFNVFLCAPTLTDRGKPSVELSLRLKAALEAEKFLVVLGEDDGLNDRRLALGLTPQSNELEYIANSCNAVILVADSPGVFSELGLFSWHFVHKKGLLNKSRAETEFILLLDQKFKSSKSYIEEGPARALNGFGQVSYVDFSSFDFSDVLRRIRDRRGVMIVDRRGRPRAALP